MGDNFRSGCEEKEVLDADRGLGPILSSGSFSLIRKFAFHGFEKKSHRFLSRIARCCSGKRASPAIGFMLRIGVGKQESGRGVEYEASADKNWSQRAAPLDLRSRWRAQPRNRFAAFLFWFAKSEEWACVSPRQVSRAFQRSHGSNTAPARSLL